MYPLLYSTKQKTNNISPTYYIVERGPFHMLQLDEPNGNDLFKLIKTKLYVMHILTMKLIHTRGKLEFIKSPC